MLCHVSSSTLFVFPSVKHLRPFICFLPLTQMQPIACRGGHVPLVKSYARFIPIFDEIRPGLLQGFVSVPLYPAVESAIVHVSTLRE